MYIVFGRKKKKKAFFLSSQGQKISMIDFSLKRLEITEILVIDRLKIKARFCFIGMLSVKK